MHFREINSTSTYARENISSLSLPALISADYQSAGRGRRGKSFYSPVSGVYFTLVFEADGNFDLITPAAAVCVCRVLKELCGTDAEIKWVNDVFVGGKKVCGILTERYMCGEKAVTSIGIGINLNTESFPDDLPQAGSIKADVKASEIAAGISELILEVNENYNRNEILESYRNKLFIIGREITYAVNNIEKSGTVKGINDDCNLIVDCGGKEEILSSGEISIKLR